jgi:hypothetical protein
MENHPSLMLSADCVTDLDRIDDAPRSIENHSPSEVEEEETVKKCDEVMHTVKFIYMVIPFIHLN